MTKVYTIGHSTRTLDEFLAILAKFGILVVVDIRTVPRSRHNPQFNSDVLKSSLEENGIAYVHLKGLGGLRHPTGENTNAAWRNDSFRGFADYMQTPEFRSALEELITIARERTTVIMCAEAVPWRCHRSLIGDALLVEGVEVEHIMSVEGSRPHKITPFAKVVDGKVTYPPAADTHAFPQPDR